MKCYEHVDAEAVGACKNCGKGTCTRCCRVESHGIYCSVGCADHGAKLHEMNRRSLRIYGIGEPQSSISPALLIYGSIGLLFIAFAALPALEERDAEYLDWRGLIFGGIFLAFGIYAWMRQKRLGLSC